MRYTNEEIGLSFDLPDEPTVLDIIGYDSRRIQRSDMPAILMLWECVKPLLLNWECEALPNPHADLAKVTGATAAKAVEWAAFRGADWRTGLNEVSKNS